MNGAQSLVKTLLAGGVDVCFSNPGTSEMHFVAALDSVPGMRCVLALFEGVATGAADGYYRLSGRPASTLLHLGPGLANGLANLHNAKKAGSGVVNIVGEHATGHIALDAPLTSDIEGLARPMSNFVRVATSSATVGADGAAAVTAARTPPGGIATLILPGDAAWDPGGVTVTPEAAPMRPVADDSALSAAADALAKGKGTLLLLGGAALDTEGLEWAGRIAAKTGCDLLSEWANARLERGVGRVAIRRIPYVVEQAVDLLKDYERIVLVGARRPVAFFAYPDKPGILVPDRCEIIPAAGAGDDLIDALAALADRLGATGTPPSGIAQTGRPEVADGPLDPTSIGSVLGATLPEGAVVIDESITSGRNFFAATAGAPPHSWLNNLGGSIGFSLPLAIGAAIAAPERKIIALVGDGSAYYTIQALWTMAREDLDITVVVFSNRLYRILMGELTNVGVDNPGPRALDMLSLSNPETDWVQMARSMGVDGVRVTDGRSFEKAMTTALTEPHPRLIEVVL
ncbi:MAG: acetolactate synthase large subunit [Pseudomonadota bacterium]